MVLERIGPRVAGLGPYWRGAVGLMNLIGAAGRGGQCLAGTGEVGPDDLRRRIGRSAEIIAQYVQRVADIGEIAVELDELVRRNERAVGEDVVGGDRLVLQDRGGVVLDLAAQGSTKRAQTLLECVAEAGECRTQHGARWHLERQVVDALSQLTVR